MNKKTKRSTQWVKTKKIKYAGIHLIAECWGGKIREDSKEIEKILIEAARAAKNIPLKIAIHKFKPQGITGFVLLAKSHIALHSWPEFDYLAIDIYTCGERTLPHKAFDYLKKKFKPRKIKIKEIKRGIP